MNETPDNNYINTYTEAIQAKTFNGEITEETKLESDQFKISEATIK